MQNFKFEPKPAREPSPTVKARVDLVSRMNKIFKISLSDALHYVNDNFQDRTHIITEEEKQEFIKAFNAHKNLQIL